VSSNKRVGKTIMALKPNQLQVTTYHPQANAIIEQLHNIVFLNDMVRSFDLENNHENIEGENLFDYLLQSSSWLPSH
jgi:hypothetical protein